MNYLQDQGYTAIGLDIKEPSSHFKGLHHTCDLLDKDHLVKTVQHLKPDAIVHLAARTDLEGLTTDDYAVNSIGVANLTDAIFSTKSVQRCLFTSSQLVCRVGYIPTHNEDYCPPNAYGMSKVLTEREVRRSDGGGAPWCLLRPTTIWGRGMNSHYAAFFRHLRNGRYFHPGRQDLYKSYGYVGNTVYQIEKFLVSPNDAIHRQIFYLADYEPISLPRWIDAIAVGLERTPPHAVPLLLCRVLAKVGDLFRRVGLERHFPFNSFRLNNILAEYKYDLSATQQICGALPYSLEEGVTELVAWVKENN